MQIELTKEELELLVNILDETDLNEEAEVDLQDKLSTILNNLQ